jgi:hypothetical protein
MDRCPLTATAISLISISSASTSDRLLYSVNSVRTWSYYLLALFPQSVTGSWMETDQVGDAGGKGGNLKKSRPSWDPHRLNSDKQMENKKLTLNSFLVILLGQSSMPTGSSSKVVRGERTGCGVVVVIGWMLCSVDTAKKNSPNSFFSPFFVSLPTHTCHTHPPQWINFRALCMECVQLK